MLIILDEVIVSTVLDSIVLTWIWLKILLDHRAHSIPPPDRTKLPLGLPCRQFRRLAKGMRPSRHPGAPLVVVAV